MVHVWSINSGEQFQGHHGPLVFISGAKSKNNLGAMQPFKGTPSIFFFFFFFVIF